LYFYLPKSTKNDKLEGLKLGAIDFIKKPFFIQELIQKIESILANSEKQKKAVINTAFNALSKPQSSQLKNPIDRQV